jgi:uncharacterized membrane protein YfbV (UPF0208 family)
MINTLSSPNVSHFATYCSGFLFVVVLFIVWEILFMRGWFIRTRAVISVIFAATLLLLGIVFIGTSLYSMFKVDLPQKLMMCDIP